MPEETEPYALPTREFWITIYLDSLRQGKDAKAVADKAVADLREAFPNDPR